MNEHRAAVDWMEVIGFLKRNLPRSHDRESAWDHMFSTAYQIGCEALVALGQAEETARGAMPRLDPRLPDALPRWDDICVATLYLADQHDLVSYRLTGGGLPSLKEQRIARFISHGRDAPPILPPNIIAAHGLNPARAEPEALSVLRALGLVSENRWVEAAETVFWRVQPLGWELEFGADARFLDAVEAAVHAIPDDICASLEQLVTITEADVSDAAVSYAKHRDEFRSKYPSADCHDIPESRERTISGLISARKNALDWLFFGRWRLSEGWLNAVQARSALAIFHDPLAIAMRRSVVARLYPHSPVMAG